MNGGADQGSMKHGRPGESAPRDAKLVDNIVLLHMRKAGGTSLRQYVRHLSDKVGLESRVIEGRTVDYKSLFCRQDRTLYLTSIREPVARIKSSYRFEGRWHIEEKERRLDNAVSFAEWVDRASNTTNTDFVWNCVSNYYIKTLVGYPKRGGEGIGVAELDLAREVLNRFDIVLITEWMSNPEIHRYVRNKLDFNQAIPNVRYPTESPNPVHEQSEIFDERTLERIDADNMLDKELYQYARELAKSRIRQMAASSDTSGIISYMGNERAISKAVSAQDSMRDCSGAEVNRTKLASCAIMGGLANQLFEVANVLAYAHRHGCVPVFDTSVTESPSMIRPQPTYWDTLFSRAVALGNGAVLDKSRSRVYPDPAYEYTEIAPDEGDTMFWGHFLSYKYFHDCREHIVELIARNPMIRDEVDRAERRMRSKLPTPARILVSIHVRRGDSLRNGTLARLSLDYYRQAARSFDDACFIVFSDDIPWCRSNLGIDGDVHYVESEKDYVDLLLMARCDHHIIANSTFSWWSAYLNESENARVLYPYPWFRGKKHSTRDMSDFFMPGWEKLYSGEWFEF